VLAVASRRFNVRVHAFCVLSNHFHLIVTDLDARLPAFEQYLDSLVARAVNASLGRWESFWAPSSYSAVALTTPDDIVAKTAYVLANPVAAGLVRRGADWPGLWSDPEEADRTPLTVLRPTVFFRANGSMPESAELELATPPGFASSEDFRDQLSSALVHVEERARRELDSEGRGFLGAARVLSQNAWCRSTSSEPRRNLKPRIAARNKWKRIEALARLSEFVRAYRKARAAMRAGARDAIFPAGTYLLRVVFGVPCAECA
jgi:REP element-mobilizing transposase RayT